MNQNNTQHNGNSNEVPPIIQQPEDSDIEMETQDDVHNGHGDSCNGKNSNGYQNGNSHNPTELPQEISICDNEDEDMGKKQVWKCPKSSFTVYMYVTDVDVVPVSRKNYAKPAVERILEFGRELYSMSQRLNVDKISSEHNQKMLEVSIKVDINWLILVVPGKAEQSGLRVHNFSNNAIKTFNLHLMYVTVFEIF